jgi:thioredoxin-dependent peroxiredoxin
MYKMALRLDVGSKAEDFSLKNGDGNEVKLSGLIGKGNVLLIFFLGGFDKAAVSSLEILKNAYQGVRDMDTEVVAITPELQAKAGRLSKDLMLPFTVLSDPDFRVVKAYDVYDKAGNWTYPAAFIIDKTGIIQYAFRGASTPNTPPIEYIIGKLGRMKEGKP